MSSKHLSKHHLPPRRPRSGPVQSPEVSKKVDTPTGGFHVGATGAGLDPVELGPLRHQKCLQKVTLPGAFRGIKTTQRCNLKGDLLAPLVLTRGPLEFKIRAWPGSREVL